MYGGATNNDNSGTISYMQIRYSGYVLSANSELQVLTTESIGSQTKIDHVMSYNSSDDGAEFFGGRAPNQSSDLASILLRGDTDYTLVNGVLTSMPLNPCLQISQAQTASATANPAIDELGAPEFRSVLMQCATQKYIGSNGVTEAQVASIFGAGMNGNSDTYTPTLTSIFINGATEAVVTPFDASVLNAASGIPSGTGGLGGQAAFFDKISYIGAVRDASDTWYKGWVCNSSTLDFGTGNTGLCTSLPTT